VTQHENLLLRVKWLLFNLTLMCWGLGSFYIGSADNIESARFYWKLSMWAVAFIPVAFCVFAYELADRKLKLSFLVIYILYAIVFASSHQISIFTGVSNMHSLYYLEMKSKWYLIFPTIWIVIASIGLVLLCKGCKRYYGLSKFHIICYFISIFIGFVGGISNFLPIIGFKFYPYGNFAVLCYPYVITFIKTTTRYNEFNKISECFEKW
jgi:hypothetical protein